MTKKILVRDYMSKQLITLTLDMEVLRAVHVLLENKVSGAPVVDDRGGLAGMMTERDCMKVVLNAAYYQEYGGLVKDFMATDLTVIAPDVSIVDAAKLFYENRFLRYPVVENETLIGVISRSDVMRAMGDYWQ